MKFVTSTTVGPSLVHPHVRALLTYEKRVYMNAAKSTTHRLYGVHSIISNKWNFQSQPSGFPTLRSLLSRGTFYLFFQNGKPIGWFSCNPHVKTSNSKRESSRLNLFSSVIIPPKPPTPIKMYVYYAVDLNQADRSEIRIRSFLTLLWLELFRRK